MGCVASTASATSPSPRGPSSAGTVFTLRSPASSFRGSPSLRSPQTPSQRNALASPGAARDRSVAVLLSAKRRGRVLIGDAGTRPADRLDAGASAIVQKSAAERSFLCSALAANGVFAVLEDEERGALADVMAPRSVAAGDVLIRVGDDGDTMFVVEAGRLEVVSADGRVLEWGEKVRQYARMMRCAL